MAHCRSARRLVPDVPWTSPALRAVAKGRPHSSAVPRGRSFRNQGQRKEFPAARIPRDPDEVIANAHSRVGKLESAISVHPIILALKEALRLVRSQTQVRPVEERIHSTKLFIERAKKRLLSFQEKVAKAQTVLREAEAKVLTEEDSLREGGSRLAALQLEAQRGQERIPPQHQQILRRSWQNCVFAWLQRERTTLLGSWRVPEGPSLGAAARAMWSLAGTMDFEPPSWEALASGGGARVAARSCFQSRMAIPRPSPL